MEHMGMKWIRDHGLTLTMTAIFLIFWVAQSLTGFNAYNNDQISHGEETIAFSSYLSSGHFIEATFENWESEFLQMGFYVLLTAFLYQRGSAESKDPDKQEDVDEDPRLRAADPNAPWPVRHGGISLWVYNQSLSLALLGLFAISFALHVYGGAREYNAQQITHGGPTVSTIGFLGTSEFWFQSFQNWQSEFLAVATLAFLSVFLRQKGSPESKPVAAPHAATGEG
jgi:hypothetical protein